VFFLTTKECQREGVYPDFRGILVSRQSIVEITSRDAPAFIVAKLKGPGEQEMFSLAFFQ